MSAFLSPGKEKKSPEPQYFQGIRRKEEWEKEEERDGFRIRFLRGIRGKRMEERKEEERKDALFQSFRDCLSLQGKERNPVVSREGEGKEEREKRGSGWLGGWDI